MSARGGLARSTALAVLAGLSSLVGCPGSAGGPATIAEALDKALDVCGYFILI